MMDRTKTHQPAGDRVCVRTRYGWEFEGELQMADSEGIRVFDPVMDEVVWLGRDELVEVEGADGFVLGEEDTSSADRGRK